MTDSLDVKDMLVASTSRIINKANKAKQKAKGLITTDTQYRIQYANVIKLLQKADELSLKKGSDNKLKKLEKEIVNLSLEILDYERFRMDNP